MRAYFRRLLLAGFITASFAALAHTAFVLFAEGYFAMDAFFIFSLSLVVAFIVALIGGTILLAIAGLLKLRPLPALILFLITIQAISIGLEAYIYRISFVDMSWEYGLISVPASIIAWYFSVYWVHRAQQKVSYE